MYKIISIDQYAMTRNVNLRNELTGIIDVCFDDSALVSDTNFEFMEIGEVYDCKIMLFGNAVEEKTKKSVVCKIVNTDIKVGETSVVKVLVNEDTYYIYKSDVEEFLGKDSIIFEFTRKNLIQVNDTIHCDLL